MNVHPSQKKKKKKKPADDCGRCWAFQEQVTDGLGLAEARATRERAACLLDLIDICLAWQFSLPGCESRRVHGCIIADLCFSTHVCHDMTGLS